jgi:hypothetical protein
VRAYSRLCIDAIRRKIESCVGREVGSAPDEQPAAPRLPAEVWGHETNWAIDAQVASILNVDLLRLRGEDRPCSLLRSASDLPTRHDPGRPKPGSHDRGRAGKPLPLGQPASTALADSYPKTSRKLGRASSSPALVPPRMIPVPATAKSKFGPHSGPLVQRRRWVHTKLAGRGKTLQPGSCGQGRRGIAPRRSIVRTAMWTGRCCLRSRSGSWRQPRGWCSPSLAFIEGAAAS